MSITTDAAEVVMRDNAPLVTAEAIDEFVADIAKVVATTHNLNTGLPLVCYFNIYI